LLGLFKPLLAIKHNTHHAVKYILLKIKSRRLSQMSPRVLVSDKLSDTAVQIFRDRGIDVDFQPELGKDKELLLKIISQYDGLAIRSATKVTEKIIKAAVNLKVIGRAGIGVDNVDIPFASKKGIIVMNTPFGNSITTAEHAISMMMAVARQIPDANTSTHSGKWEKSRFMGVELTSKTLGVIGVGNIGTIVCDRALGLKMKVIAYDPYLSAERAQKIGITKVELDELFAKSDFITLHVPLTDLTRNIISKAAIEKLKPNVHIINCARGGLVDEEALAIAIQDSRVAGAALDVFAQEPATNSPLFNLANVVVTPHLGAATKEAQENVAIQIAEQMSDYLLSGAVSNALNMPSVTAEEAIIMRPWLKLAENLGSFIGQMTTEPLKEILITYNGSVASMNLNALDCASVAGILKTSNPDVNMISAPIIAKDRGVQISTIKQDKTGVFEGYIKIKVVTPTRERSIAGTVFSDGKPRFIQVKGLNIDSEISEHMIYTTNKDVPGIIGVLGGVLGKNNVNIANFTLGRSAIGGEAIALLSVDGQPAPTVLKSLKNTGFFHQVQALTFITN
jgi:D-3-phosphoglycerate dehydrogenase